MNKLASAIEIAKYINQHIDFSEREMLELLPRIEVKHIKKNETLFHYNKIPNSTGFIVNGLLKLAFKRPDESEGILTFLSDGEFAGDYPNYLTQQTSDKTVIAIEDSTILLVPRDLLEELYDKASKWNKLGRIIAENTLIKLVKRQQMLLSISPQEQYELFQNEFPHLLNRISNKEISAYLGIRAESLSRIRKRALSS